MKNNPNFRSFLREMRLRSNLSKTELAYRTGININTVDSLEKGRISCSELNSRRFGEFFKCDWRQFVTKVGKSRIKKSENEKEKE